MAQTAYRPEYCEGIIEFFSKPPFETMYKEEYYQNGTLKSKTPILTACKYPTFQDYARSIGVHADTLSEWKKVHKEFSEAYARAKAIQEGILLINGLQGLYNSQFAQFVGKNCFGYTDKGDGTGTPNNDDKYNSLEQIDERLAELLSDLPEGDRKRILQQRAS